MTVSGTDSDRLYVFGDGIYFVDTGTYSLTFEIPALEFRVLNNVSAAKTFNSRLLLDGPSQIELTKLFEGIKFQNSQIDTPKQNIDLVFTISTRGVYRFLYKSIQTSGGSSYVSSNQQGVTFSNLKIRRIK